jgi:hypothetical protein
MTKQNKIEIDICLDEIESSIENFSKSSEESKKELMSWIRRNKLLLKELNYKGKVPRMRNGKNE